MNKERDKVLGTLRWEEDDYHATIEFGDAEIAFRTARDEGNDVVICRDDHRREGIATIHDPDFTAHDIEDRLYGSV